MTLFIGQKGNLSLRLTTLLAMLGLIVATTLVGNGSATIYILSIYLATTSFCTAVNTWRSQESNPLLKLAALFLFLIGVHWLDYPIMSTVEWFVPIGFLIGLVLALGVYFSLATVALLQFKQITNDSEQKAIQAAIHDPLTGVFNRSHLQALFDDHKAKIEESKGTFVMLYLDLDGFKQVNDTYGHKAGDEVLIVVTKRLKTWLGTKGTVVRIGGDELVIINTLRSEAGANIVYGTSAAQRILKLIENPIVDGKNTYNISASIGGCYYAPEFDEMEVMLSRADELMYSAKQAGKRRVHFGNIPEEVPATVSLTSTENLTEPLRVQASVN